MDYNIYWTFVEINKEYTRKLNDEDKGKFKPIFSFLNYF